MRLFIHVRELDFEYETSGTQTFKWLGNVVAARYGEYHNISSLAPVNISSDTHGLLYPQERINHRCNDGDNIYVELLGPSRGLYVQEHAREVTLWERLAYTPDMNWVTVEFTFDSSELDLNGQVPTIEGNINGWSELIPMRLLSVDTTGCDGESDDENVVNKQNTSSGSSGGNEDEPSKNTIWTLRHRVPAGSELVFRFHLGDTLHISDQYETVHDVNNNVFNYLQVHKPVPDFTHLQGAYNGEKSGAVNGGIPNITTSNLPTVVRAGSAANTPRTPSSTSVHQTHLYDSNNQPITIQVTQSSGSSANTKRKRLVSQRVIGSAHELDSESTKQYQQQAVSKMFEHDWSKMQFADVVRKRAQRLAVKDVLWSYAKPLQQLFQYYSSRGDGGVSFMSCWEFLTFCNQCKIIDDSNISTRVVDFVFKRVNVEEEFDEDWIEAHPDQFRKAMRLVPDPLNPDHAFIRGEFMESLVRLAIRKWPEMNIADALTQLLTEYVMKYGYDAASDTIRAELLDASVQAVFRPYAKSLRDLFSHVAKLDLTDTDHYGTVSVKEFATFLTERHLLDHDLSRRAALQSFAMSQTLVSEEYQMHYSEFVEAIGRLAHVKYPKKSTVAQRVQLFLERDLFSRD